MKESNNEVVDIREKNNKEILETYKVIANETQLQNSIWTITQNYEAAQNMYTKIKQIRETKRK